MSAGGYFKLQRDGWLWDLPAPQFKVAITILSMANWKDGKTVSGGELVEVKRGQLMTSLPALARKSQCSVQCVRTTLGKLKQFSFLTEESTKRYRLITITNYSKYQDRREHEQHEEQQSDQQSSNSSLTVQQQSSNTDRRREEGKKKSSGTSAPPEFQDALDHFHELYRARYGQAPSWQPKQRGILISLIRAHGAEEVKARAEAMFTNTPSWLTGTLDLGTLSANFDKFIKPARTRQSNGFNDLDLFEGALGT